MSCSPHLLDFVTFFLALDRMVSEHEECRECSHSTWTGWLEDWSNVSAVSAGSDIFATLP